MIKCIDLKSGIKKFILKSDFLEVHILNYGAIIQKILYQSKNMVLGYEDPKKYINNPSFAGALIGRTAGRIENSKYTLNNKIYNLDIVEDFRNTNLHGGFNNYSNTIFDYEIKDNKLILTYLDNNKIYDEKVFIEAIYSIENNKLNIEYKANSNNDTYINLTNHTYFNLGAEDILNHQLKLNSNFYWSLKDNMTPKDKKNVENTIFDFRKSKNLSSNLNDDNEDFKISYYFDHPFELNKEHDYDVKLVNSENNISMILKTNQKYLIMYTGNFLHEVSNFDNFYNKRHLGIALEAQNLPNGINISKEYFNITNKENPYIEKISFEFFGGE